MSSHEHNRKRQQKRCNMLSCRPSTKSAAVLFVTNLNSTDTTATSPVANKTEAVEGSDACAVGKSRRGRR